MLSATPSFTWEEALHEFFLHLQATRAKKTQRYYEVQLGGLARWAANQDVPFTGFGKRHMDRYLVGRSEAGKAPLTLHHDAVCAKAFFHWCQKNDIVERSLLSDYEVRHAPRPSQYMPTDGDMQTLLREAHEFWNPAKNPAIRYVPVNKRVFHRDRNYAIILGLLDSASRIGEMLSLKVDDYRAKERQIVIRESKGREPRTLPVSDEWVEALGVWLRQRAKVMAGQSEDEGWLFISEFGGRLDEGRFLKALKKVITYTGISDHITLHSLRRYSLNRLAKVNLLATQQIAGHKETRTTLLYTQLDPEARRVMLARHRTRRTLVALAQRPISLKGRAVIQRQARRVRRVRLALHDRPLGIKHELVAERPLLARAPSVRCPAVQGREAGVGTAESLLNDGCAAVVEVVGGDAVGGLGGPQSVAVVGGGERACGLGGGAGESVFGVKGEVCGCGAVVGGGVSVPVKGVQAQIDLVVAVGGQRQRRVRRAVLIGVAEGL